MARKRKKSSFRGRVNKDAQRQKQAGVSYGYMNLPKGISIYSPTPGTREKFDILPYEITDKKHPDLDPEVGLDVGELWYKRPFKVHRSIGVDNDTVVCLSSFGKKCPICEYRRKRVKEGAEKDELKGYNSSSRNLYVVIPKGIKKLEEEPHIFDMSQYLFQNLLNEELEEDEDYEVFPDLEEGLTLRIRWSEESFAGNKYAEANRIDFLDRTEVYEEAILEEIPNLDKILKELSYDELNAKFLEMEEDEDTDGEPFKEEEDEKPKRRKKTTKKKEEKDLTWEDLADMDDVELSEVIESKELDIDVDDYEEEEELMEAVAEELGIEKPKKETPKRTSSKTESKTTKTKTEPRKSKKKDEDECPEGYQFGIDTDDKDECEDCKMWDKCIDKKEEED